MYSLLAPFQRPRPVSPAAAVATGVAAAATGVLAAATGLAPAPFVQPTYYRVVSLPADAWETYAFAQNWEARGIYQIDSYADIAGRRWIVVVVPDLAYKGFFGSWYLNFWRGHPWSMYRPFMPFRRRWSGVRPWARSTWGGIRPRWYDRVRSRASPLPISAATGLAIGSKAARRLSPPPRGTPSPVLPGFGRGPFRGGPRPMGMRMGSPRRGGSGSASTSASASASAPAFMQTEWFAEWARGRQ
jgi:hypothetical protein